MKRYGKRLAIVLDRAINKRCEFLFLKKKYKQKEGEYEQIEWGRASRFPLLSIRKRNDPGKFKLSLHYSCPIIFLPFSPSLTPPGMAKASSIACCSLYSTIYQ